MVVVQDYHSGEYYTSWGPVSRRGGRRSRSVSLWDAGRAVASYVTPGGLFNEMRDKRQKIQDDLNYDFYRRIYGLNFDPENPSVPLEGPNRNPTVERPTVPAVTDGGGTDQSVTPMGKGIVSHSAQHCCVDLGGFPIPAKPFTHIDSGELGPKNFFIQYHQELKETAANKTLFVTLAEPKIDNFGGTSSSPIHTWETADGVNAVHGAGFNSTKKLQDAWTKLGLTYPTYDYTTGTGVTDPNDANRAIVLQNQYIEFKFKNFGEQTGTPNDSPLFLTIYGYQFTKDIFSTGTSATTQDNYQLDYGILNGWQSYFDGSTATTNLERSRLQPYGINVSENMFLETNCKCIGVLKNCLAMGQEGTARFMLKEPQYLTFSQFARSQPMNPTGYRNIIYRKGEIFFFVKAHGGLQGTTSTTGVPTSVRMQQVNFACYTLSRWEFREVLRSTKNPKYSLSVTTDTAANNVDVDVEQYFAY